MAQKTRKESVGCVYTYFVHKCEPTPGVRGLDGDFDRLPPLKHKQHNFRDECRNKGGLGVHISTVLSAMRFNETIPCAMI